MLKLLISKGYLVMWQTGTFLSVPVFSLPSYRAYFPVALGPYSRTESRVLPIGLDALAWGCLHAAF